jgi:hypothetical protein
LSAACGVKLPANSLEEIRKNEKAENEARASDLAHSRTAVPDSLRAPESKRGYRHALDEFIEWYCSEPRLSLNKVVVTGFRIALENRGLAARNDQGATCSRGPDYGALSRLQTTDSRSGERPDRH